jgi:hypothetical protein
LWQLKAIKNMSNDRCTADYFPIVAYVIPRQMAERGNLWPYSTRAVEARGARYKKIRRRVVCFRQPAKEVMRAVRNKKSGTVSFKKSAYASCSTIQMLRTSSSQEESAHRSTGRSRIATTGRLTLCRTMPKWEQEELPEMGNLLEPEALLGMLEKLSLMFADEAAVGFATAAVLEGVPDRM